MSIIPPGSLCFDIGAHHGETAKAMIAAGAGKVISVEPALENYLRLLEHIPDSVTPVHAAVNSVPRIVRLCFCSTGDGGLSTENVDVWRRMYPQHTWNKPQWVAGTTVSELMRTFGMPAVIKIDTEGSDDQVIAGMTTTVPLLCFEFHWKDKGRTVCAFQLLRELGYTRASYCQGDLDWFNLPTLPELPIAECEKRWNDMQPEWGNICVAQ